MITITLQSESEHKALQKMSYEALHYLNRSILAHGGTVSSVSPTKVVAYKGKDKVTFQGDRDALSKVVMAAMTSKLREDVEEGG